MKKSKIIFSLLLASQFSFIISAKNHSQKTIKQQQQVCIGHSYNPDNLFETSVDINLEKQLNFKVDTQKLEQGKVQVSYKIFNNEDDFKNSHFDQLNFFPATTFKKTNIIGLKMAAIIPKKPLDFFTIERQAEKEFLEKIFKGVTVTPMKGSQRHVSKKIPYLGNFMATISITGSDYSPANSNSIKDLWQGTMSKDHLKAILSAHFDSELGSPSRVMLANFQDPKKLSWGISIPHMNIAYRYYPYGEESTLILYYKVLHLKSSLGGVSKITKKAMADEEEDVINIVTQLKSW